DTLSDLYGGYIFGDWGRGNGRLFLARPPALGMGLWKITEIQVSLPGNQSSMGQLLGIGQDEQGEIYLLTKEPGTGPTGDSGKVYRIVPSVP
ncbi:MAG TPA: hypothetical protein VFM35_11065, partial [Candidatus Binatia bacterium]|nr:hypothetical protein [Candidatus Binatia bacterium]